MRAATIFGLNPERPPPQVLRFGSVDEPVVVFDAVFADPNAIIAEAARHGVFTQPITGRAGFPGPQAPAPKAYVHALIEAIDAAFVPLFGTPTGSVGNVTCQFSLVTLAPAALHPLQRVPHIDIADSNRFAVLHFLCGEPFGGTAFYRQNETGLELVRRDDWTAFTKARDVAAAEAQGYPSRNTPGFTQIGDVSARMNRVIVYRSNFLHSGMIPDGPVYSSNPSSGRLTGNLFARYRAAPPERAI